MRICISNFNLFFYAKKCFSNLFFPRFLLSKWKYLSIWNSSKSSSNHCNANIIALLKSNMVSISSQTVEKQHHQIHTNKIILNKNSFLPCNQRKCALLSRFFSDLVVFMFDLQCFSPKQKVLTEDKKCAGEFKFSPFFFRCSMRMHFS